MVQNMMKRTRDVSDERKCSDDVDDDYSVDGGL